MWRLRLLTDRREGIASIVISFFLVQENFMSTPKLLVFALTAASLTGSMTLLQAQTTPAQPPANAPAVTTPTAAPTVAPTAVPAVTTSTTAPTPVITPPTGAAPAVSADAAAAPTSPAPFSTTPLPALPTEPTAAGAMTTAPSAMPVESNIAKPMAAEPAVINAIPPVTSTSAAPSNADYTQRAKPLPAATAALRNDRSTLASGRGERPARADRN